mmetsp:Transcript_1998/g.7975  ORF Transcript_1998/g.7975 Transcript_1998/m.7975 type:complete len:291 (+) Transcript_1998:468-1340(+)
MERPLHRLGVERAHLSRALQLDDVHVPPPSAAWPRQREASLIVVPVLNLDDVAPAVEEAMIAAVVARVGARVDEADLRVRWDAGRAYVAVGAPLLDPFVPDLRTRTLPARRPLAVCLHNGFQIGAVEEGVAQVMRVVQVHEASIGIIFVAAAEAFSEALFVIEEHHHAADVGALPVALVVVAVVRVLRLLDIPLLHPFLLFFEGIFAGLLLLSRPPALLLLLLHARLALLLLGVLPRLQLSQLPRGLSLRALLFLLLCILFLLESLLSRLLGRLLLHVLLLVDLLLLGSS